MRYSQGHEGDEDGRDKVELHRDRQEPRPRHALKHATTLTTMPMVQLPITLSYQNHNVSTQRDLLQNYVFCSTRNNVRLSYKWTSTVTHQIKRVCRMLFYL